MCQVLEKIQVATKDKDDRVKKVLDDCANELKDYADDAEEILSHKHPGQARGGHPSHEGDHKQPGRGD